MKYRIRTERRIRRLGWFLGRIPLRTFGIAGYYLQANSDVIYEWMFFNAGRDAEIDRLDPLPASER